MGGYYDKCWLMGLRSTQAMVECIVLRAVWHWGINSSVINSPLGEAGCTPLYIGLASTQGSVFSPVSLESCLTGDSERYE